MGIISKILVSLIIISSATDNPVKKNPDGTITIDTSTLKTIDGYMGPTPLIIHLDANERISKIDCLPNDETPKFWKRVVDKLSTAWDGVPADKVDSFKVDAVTGATYSSKSFIANVNAGIACYLEYKSNK